MKVSYKCSCAHTQNHKHEHGIIYIGALRLVYTCKVLVYKRHLTQKYERRHICLKYTHTQQLFPSLEVITTWLKSATDVRKYLAGAPTMGDPYATACRLVALVVSTGAPGTCEGKGEG